MSQFLIGNGLFKNFPFHINSVIVFICLSICLFGMIFIYRSKQKKKKHKVLVVIVKSMLQKINVIYKKEMLLLLVQNPDIKNVLE